MKALNGPYIQVLQAEANQRLLPDSLRSPQSRVVRLKAKTICVNSVEMSKNKNQHYVPAFYLYNFTNETQRTDSDGRPKRETKIYHYDFVRGCVRERPIEKVAIESFLLSYKNSDGTYDHTLDLEIQSIEKKASFAILALNEIFEYALKKKPKAVPINNDVMDNVLELLFWQLKRHPDIVESLEKDCEQYLMDKGWPKESAKEMALKVIKEVGKVDEYDIKEEFHKKNKIILCTSNVRAHFITTDKPFVRLNKTGPDGIAMPGTEMYYPITSRMLLFMHENGERKEFRLERHRDFLRNFNTYMAKSATRYLFGPSKTYLERIYKNIA